MKKITLALVLISLAAVRSAAQGCSDAGVCTIHSFKNNTEKYSEEGKNNNEIMVGFAFGKGERSISYYTPYIQYTRSITDRTSVTGKVVFAAIRGELTNTTGLGDLFLSFNHAIDVKKKWQKSLVAGLKIPLDKADIVKDDIHLPMPYQTSLGTTDLVLGVNAARKSFGVTLAWQQPLQKTNGNQFLPENYPSEPLAYRYLPTNSFERKGDLLLRLSYNFNLNKKFSVRPGLLSIYHLGNDSYLDRNKMRREIALSNGLTLNGNVFLDYRVSKTSEFELSLGTPFVVRTNRPDGLTRSFVASLEYKFSF
ncbi:MAG: hypothetical protein JNK14_01740 [Chitinophagaceae bacterium]|nr:hypothetical protein [Chitinophagaceae bacterium]